MKKLSILTVIFLLTLSHALGYLFDDQIARLMTMKIAKIFTNRTNSNQTEWDPTIWDNEELEEHISHNVGEKEDDRIIYNNLGLPGQPKTVSFKQYAGYVKVDKSKGRHMFYYFAEAVHSPSQKPLVLWLNGGPGCSSLGYGAMGENGPFGVNPDGKTLFNRPYSWNKAANILYLESPTSVGFSYSNDTTDYKDLGDKNSARDAYAFLLKWFERFSEYKDRDFYMAGESYAGIYIPELADLIRHKNMKAGKPIIRLKGIMLGNPIIDRDIEIKGTYDYLWTHALISDETHSLITKYCFDPSSDSPESIEKCHNLLTTAYNETGIIDPYAIYAPVCHIPKNSSLPVSSPTREHGSYDPCLEIYVKSYLNLPQVQKALHVKPTSWNHCWQVLNSKIFEDSMFGVYKRLIDAQIRILVYSGDIDSIVSVTSTRYSLNTLNLKVIKSWHPWVEIKSQEVAGYKVVYKGLTFATVRGAGHQVPLFQPLRAFTLFKMFLGNMFS
ncbi:serine carboxypeptidase 1-like [Impatiens glandulifera]|uniref:serine carboxypeptidase 1-like n=1 Tax=Impatiens glandulifera TaxID=253017 RepID=UPI001FB06C3A|nr:serine carboxypeptidase 1-like [Impatiens glandulifera]